MNKFNNYLRWLFYRIRNYLQLREYRKMHDGAKIAAIARFLKEKNISPVEEFTKGLPVDKQKILQQCKYFETSKLDTLYFGDSIGDFLRSKLQSIKPNGNFCRAGDTGEGFINVMWEVFSRIDCSRVKNIFIGTFGNNALGYQDISFTLREVFDCYSLSLKKCPKARIIFIGFPPVYDLYANMVAPVIYSRMLGLSGYVVNLAKLGKRFFPSVEFSSDGVHLSENGGYELDRMMQELKQ